MWLLEVHVVFEGGAGALFGGLTFLIGIFDKSFLIEEVPGEIGVAGGAGAGVGVGAGADAPDEGVGAVEAAAAAVAAAAAARLLSLGFLPGLGLGGSTQCLLVRITRPLRGQSWRLFACSAPTAPSLGAI